MIANATKQFFEFNKIPYQASDIERLKQSKESFNLVYGGGGVWYKEYRNYYQNLIDIFNSNLLQKCVILPSSFYDCDEAILAMDERFIVFCREEQSLLYAKSINKKATFILSDDMVINDNFDIYKNLSLHKYGLHLFNKDKKKIRNLFNAFYKKVYQRYIDELSKYSDFNIGYLLRNDAEKLQNELNNIPQTDLSGFGGGYCQDESLNLILGIVFLSFIDKFDNIVTDRLHIGICAAKLNKQVFLLNNIYGKNISVYNKSLKDFNNVHYIEDIKELDSLIEQNSAKSIKFDISKNIPKTFKEFLYLYSLVSNKYGLERIFWL